MPDFFLIEVSSGVIFLGQREYCDKVSTGKGDTVFSVTELELFNTFCHCAPANLSTKLAIVDIITVIQRA